MTAEILSVVVDTRASGRAEPLLFASLPNKQSNNLSICFLSLILLLMIFSTSSLQSWYISTLIRSNSLMDFSGVNFFISKMISFVNMKSGTPIAGYSQHTTNVSECQAKTQKSCNCVSVKKLAISVVLCYTNDR